MFLAKSNLALFAPCGEPSVFALVKSSLDCRLWQWHVYLLESVLHLAECCERVFLYHWEDPPIIHHCCSLWTSMRPFLCCWAHQRILFFSQNVPNCWFGYSECSCYLSDGFVLFLKPNNCLFHLYGELLWPHDVGSQQQLSNANVTLRISSRPFTCLIDVEIMIVHICPWNGFWVSCPVTYGPLKQGGGTY